MPAALDSTARICLSRLQSYTCRTSRSPCIPTIRKHSRQFSRDAENEGMPSHYRRSQPPHRTDESRPPNPAGLNASDVVEHLRKTFLPLEFPPDVAQRMTTHVSWNRGVDGHNGRLGFVGRRVLHTFLLLFLHECTLPPPTRPPSQKAAIPPSERLRLSSLSSGGPVGTLSQSYDDISEKLLDTYALGEHVGAAWELERVMRWTPAVAELDAVKADAPHTILRSSGLYKVRGATVEGVVGGLFHQFGGSIAHQVFHTRVLPHLSHLGLPAPVRARAEEACQRLGGRRGPLAKPSGRPTGVRPQREHEGLEGPDSGRLKDRDTVTQQDLDYTKVNVEQKARERRRMGYVG